MLNRSYIGGSCGPGTWFAVPTIMKYYIRPCGGRGVVSREPQLLSPLLLIRTITARSCY